VYFPLMMVVLVTACSYSMFEPNDRPTNWYESLPPILHDAVVAVSTSIAIVDLATLP
jgi:hypothetical protein